MPLNRLDVIQLIQLLVINTVDLLFQLLTTHHPFRRKYGHRPKYIVINTHQIR
jgi:hypothetical protein